LVVTALGELLDSPLLDSPLLDSVLAEDDSLLCDSPELVALDDSPEELVAVTAAVLVFLDGAESAGSFPEASCT
jgi:hypothetical protein